MTIPMGTNVRREDRPGHVGKTTRKERRGECDDVMLRLEPGGVMRLLLAPDLAEADEIAHPLCIALHAASHRGCLRHVGIAHRYEQVVIGLQPPEQAIEQRKTLALAMQDRDAGKLDEIGRHGERALGLDRRKARRFGQAGRHLVFRLALHVPHHVRWGDVVQRECACGFTPAVEMGLAVQGDEVHGTRILLIPLMNPWARQFD